MKIAVLAAPESWYYRDLSRAAGSRHEMTPVAYSQLAADVRPDANDVVSASNALQGCQAVIVRSMPPGSLEQIVFRMDLLGRMATQGVCVVNAPKAIETAVDKFLTTSLLADAGLRTPHTIVCQTVGEAVAAFVALGGDVVVKPLFGGEGRGLTRVSDEAIAERVFKALTQIDAVLYLQRFVPHDGCDMRLLVVGDEVFGMRRCHPSDWRTNISRGAHAEPLDVTDDLAALARRAAAAVGAGVAGVDLLPGRDGELYVLEVNGVPGWRALARTVNVDIAERVLRHVETLGVRGR